MFHRIHLLILFWFIPAPVFGQGTVSTDTLQVLNLKQIIDAIPFSNPDIRASSLASDALAKKRLQVSSLPDPIFGLNVLPRPIYTARGAQRLQFRAEQPVPFPGKLHLKGEIADLDAAIGSLGTDILEDDLILQSKLEYFEIYRLRQHELLIHEFQDKLRDFERVAATQYEVGRGMQQAILKAQLERNTLSTRLRDLAWQQNSAQERLSDILNRTVRIDSTDLPVPDPELTGRLNSEDLLVIALKNRPEADALDISALKANLAIDLAKKMYYPDFSVSVSYFDITKVESAPAADGSNAFAVGLSIKVPLQRGRLKARVEESRLKRNQVDARLESLVSSFKTRINDIVIRVREDDRQLLMYKSALIPQAETTLEATLSAYTTGRTDFLNLLDAERVLFTINTSYEDIYARYLKTIAMLERELGVKSISDAL